MCSQPRCGRKGAYYWAPDEEALGRWSKVFCKRHAKQYQERHGGQIKEIE